MKSMTGFGRGMASNSQLKATVELATVNRKQLDIRFAVPKEAPFLEQLVRQTVSEQLSRGVINVGLKFELLSADNQAVKINQAALQGYASQLEKIRETVPNLAPISLPELLELPGVLDTNADLYEEESTKALVGEALNEAIEKLIADRLDEGLKLKDDLLERLAILDKVRVEILERSPLVQQDYREKLVARIEEAKIDLGIDDERLLKEVAFFADRSDITEENVRLEAHLNKFAELIERTEPVGRELDFLMQEINREINTTGSKANDQSIGQNVVIFKAELERCREQIQNME